MGNDVERKEKKKKQQKLHSMSTELFESGINVDKVIQENKEKKSHGKKKRKRVKVNQVDAGEDVKSSVEEDKPSEGEREWKKKKPSRKKNRKNEEKDRVVLSKVDRAEEEVGADQSKTQGKTENSDRPKEASVAMDMRTSKSKNAAKNKEKFTKSSKIQVETEPDEVYHVSSGDEDCSKGMKKWIMEYHQSRPGLKILQQRIDEFITSHEAREEQERKEREAHASEGGWTVVVHHKGRKKTTDSESGIAVGSVAPAAVMDKMAKKKSKEIGLNFYRFQKREAQRNELMMLQSKFEQDKKRIQQLRAARKFRPY